MQMHSFSVAMRLSFDRTSRIYGTGANLYCTQVVHSISCFDRHRPPFWFCLGQCDVLQRTACACLVRVCLLHSYPQLGSALLFTYSFFCVVIEHRCNILKSQVDPASARWFSSRI
ncbi:hypothetical protein B0H12DRAFT_1112681 [Mycena haematopus]|nr:hypothetical protein B0H12DRAFT_1112681 [Mycena haematopus]